MLSILSSLVKANNETDKIKILEKRIPELGVIDASKSIVNDIDTLNWLNQQLKALKK